MKDLELILATSKTLHFNLGDSPIFLENFEKPDEISYDPDFNQVYWIYKKQYGVDFSFIQNKLSTIFI